METPFHNDQMIWPGKAFCDHIKVAQYVWPGELYHGSAATRIDPQIVEVLTRTVPSVLVDILHYLGIVHSNHDLEAL